MEFRHPSWSAARDLLLEQGVAWCVAETDDKDPAPEDLSWEPAGYLRLRKTEYPDDELAGVGGPIREALDAGSDVFCYFKHEEDGVEPEDGEAPRSDGERSSHNGAACLNDAHTIRALWLAPRAKEMAARSPTSTRPR